eukprot:SAG11_NODE_7191_length_1181_cov_1.536969_1_plen_180_part_00
MICTRARSLVRLIAALYPCHRHSPLATQSVPLWRCVHHRPCFHRRCCSSFGIRLLSVPLLCLTWSALDPSSPSRNSLPFYPSHARALPSALPVRRSDPRARIPAPSRATLVYTPRAISRAAPPVPSLSLSLYSALLGVLNAPSAFRARYAFSVSVFTPCAIFGSPPSIHPSGSAAAALV